MRRSRSVGCRRPKCPVPSKSPTRPRCCDSCRRCRRGSWAASRFRSQRRRPVRRHRRWLQPQATAPPPTHAAADASLPPHAPAGSQAPAAALWPMGNNPAATANPSLPPPRSSTCAARQGKVRRVRPRPGHPLATRLGVSKRSDLFTALAIGACWLAVAREAVPDSPTCTAHSNCLLPVVPERLLPQAAGAGPADSLPVVPGAVLPQAAAAGAANALPVVSELLLREAGHSAAAELRAVVPLRADESGVPVTGQGAHWPRMARLCTISCTSDRSPKCRSLPRPTISSSSERSAVEGWPARGIEQQFQPERADKLLLDRPAAAT